MDPYKILGIRPGASQDEIKQAYRKQAIKLHPDKGGTAEAFAQLHSSYDYLKKTNEGRYDIPIQGKYEKLQVHIPIEKLIIGSTHDIEFKNQIYEIVLPDWQSEWNYEHTFTINQYNLKVQVSVIPGSYYIKDRLLYKEIRINQIESLTGTVAKITDNLAINVPPGTGTGTEIRVSGYGFKKDNSVGDLTCIFVVDPVQLSNEDWDLSLNKLKGKYTKKYD